MGEIEYPQKSIFKNTIWNASGKLFSALAGLFLTYYIIKKIGIEKYGIYALITAAGGYFSLLDLGIGNSFVKYISEYKALNQYEKINKIIGCGFIFYFLFALLILSVFFFGAEQIVNFLKIPGDFKKEAISILIIYGAILSFSGLFSPFQAIVPAIERFDIVSSFSIFFSVLNLSGGVLFLEMGLGLYGLMLNSLLIVILSGLVYLYTSFKLFPQLKVNFFSFEKEIFYLIFSYGGKLQITRLSSIIASHLEKIIITRLVGLSYVGFYQIGNSLCEQVRNVPTLIVGALFPVFSRLSAIERKIELSEIYFRSVKYLAFITVLSLGFVAASAKFITNFWLGSNYLDSVRIIAIMAWGYMFNTVFGAVSSAVSQGIGRPDLQMRGAILNMFLNILFSFSLIYLFGFSGAAFGTAIPMTVAAFYLMKILHPLLELNNRLFFKKTLSFFMAGFMAFFITYFASHYFKNSYTRLELALILSSLFALYLFIYLLIIYLLKPFDLVDKKFFEKNKIVIIRLMGVFCYNEKYI